MIATMDRSLSGAPVTLNGDIDRPTSMAASESLLYVYYNEQVLAFSRTSGDLLHRSPVFGFVVHVATSISVTCGHVWVLSGTELIALSLDLSAIVARTGEGLLWNPAALPSADLLLVQGCMDSVLVMSLHRESAVGSPTAIEELARTLVTEDESPSTSSVSDPLLSAETCKPQSDVASSASAETFWECSVCMIQNADMEMQECCVCASPRAQQRFPRSDGLACSASMSHETDEDFASNLRAKARHLDIAADMGLRNRALVHRFQFDAESLTLELQSSTPLLDSAAASPYSFYTFGFDSDELHRDSSLPAEYGLMQCLQGDISKSRIAHASSSIYTLSLVTAIGEVWIVSQRENCDGIPWPNEAANRKGLTRLDLKNVAEFYPMSDCCLWLSWSGELFAYGASPYGALGLGHTPDKRPSDPDFYVSAQVPTRVHVPKLAQIRVSANETMCLARTMDGHVYFWGNDYSQQFDAPGLINNTRPTPQALPQFSSCRATWVSVDTRNTAICDEDGRLWLTLHNLDMLGKANRNALKLTHFNLDIEDEFVIKAEISSSVCLILCRSGRLYSFGLDSTVCVCFFSVNI